MPSTHLNKKSREDRLNLVFHALADRTRRNLLARLSQGPAMVTELAKPLAMSLPAASKHLRVLERANLISRTIDGRVHHCALAPEPLRAAQEWLDHYRCFWTETLDGLARYAEKENQKKNSPARK